MSGSTTTQLQNLLHRLSAGDTGARDELITKAYDRLRRLTAKMLRSFPVVQNQDSVGDVLHEVFPRLRRALETVTPATPADFFRLAALQVRRELIDLARRYRRQPGRECLAVPGASDSSSNPSPAGADPGNSTYDPSSLEMWREFHEHAEALPEEQRAVFDLLFYHELTQEEAAAMLQVSVPTIKRRWTAARLKLGERLHGAEK
jgi:RNA polymerase sigma-70 factor (ECF subfamily)